MLSLTNLINKAPKNLVCRYSLSISLEIINSKIGMSMNKMVSKVFDSIIDKMGALIGHDC
jgi:hypothetical protein